MFVAGTDHYTFLIPAPFATATVSALKRTLSGTKDIENGLSDITNRFVSPFFRLRDWVYEHKKTEMMLPPATEKALE